MGHCEQEKRDRGRERARGLLLLWSSTRQKRKTAAMDSDEVHRLLRAGMVARHETGKMKRDKSSGRNQGPLDPFSDRQRPTGTAPVPALSTFCALIRGSCLGCMP